MKKFEGIKTDRLASQISAATEGQAAASKQESAERAAHMRTQGRKGCKMPRLNISLTPENHEFVKVMSTVSGLSMAQFINSLIKKERESNGEDFKRAAAIRAKYAAYAPHQIAYDEEDE